jgi:molecular chaperone DnaJ
MQPGTQKSECPTCQGRGQIRSSQGFFTLTRTCSHCRGSGEIINSPCKECHGSGKVKKKRTLKIRIPAGIDEGSKIRVAGEGEAGDEGAPGGDLYVIIRLKEHEFFKRQESDLYCEIPLALTQAALGASVEIPTLDGSQTLKIPSGTQSENIFRLKGKGIKRLHGVGKGDLFVKVIVEIPKGLTKDQKELLKQLARSRGDNVDSIDKSLLDRVKNIIH